MPSDGKLNIGVLGAGPIAQFAHFESCVKAKNARLHAICDVADDLRVRMAATWQPAKSFSDYDQMLADPELDAVIVATSDAFHVPATVRALGAGKHVLCEKPIATGIDEFAELREAVAAANAGSADVIVQVGHMKRFDAGLQAARAFIDDGLGEMQALKAWYCDSTHRYTNTDALQPKPILSARAKKPSGDPKADREQYYMLAHGSHLVDTARYLGGPIESVRARLSERFGSWCWFVDVEYASGALGHLDLTVAVRMDWHEGFQIYGEHGAIVARTFNPWFYRSSEVDIFDERDASWHRALGADGHFYRRQVEGFARAALEGTSLEGADIDDGEATVRAMIAIRESVRSGMSVHLDDVSGSV